MSEHQNPIFFYKDEVEDILAGRLTQQRRPMHPQPKELKPGELLFTHREVPHLVCPYGRIGDKLRQMQRYEPVELEITDIRVEKSDNDIWEWVIDFTPVKDKENNHD